jgi:ADP-heptose:LPS heptosyltransferase
VRRDDATPGHRPAERGLRDLHPGTSGFGGFKRWPPRFLPADRLAERGLPVTYGPGEEELVARVRGGARTDPTPLPTSSLAALAEAIRRASVFVAADTGPLHVAAAVGTPLVGLFGPKDPAIYGPVGSSPTTAAPGPLPVVVAADVPCRPVLRRCPEPVCMSSIEVDAVLAHVSGRPGRRGSAPPSGKR